MFDHRDSFVDNPVNFWTTVLEVVSLRSAAGYSLIENPPLDLNLVSSGSERTANFSLSEAISLVIDKSVPVFGVCRFLRGIIE